MAVRKYPLLADTAPNIFGRAIGRHTGNDNFNQIVVLEGVQIQEGQVDVLYIGTDQGNVIVIPIVRIDIKNPPRKWLI